jgi:hypothetical protein
VLFQYVSEMPVSRPLSTSELAAVVAFVLATERRGRAAG